ncbi:MAG: hypothetical protein JW862_18270 [Anaerolineales bacterium]|nr:hypothetical protein [Anaerolineales bacterium]
MISLLLFGLLGLTGCRPADGVVIAQPTTVLDSPVSRTATATRSAATLIETTVEPPVAGPGQLVLFRNVLAGDYQLTSLSAAGELVFIRWNFLYQLLEYRGGTLPVETARQIFARLLGSEFMELAGFYALPTPSPDNPLLYEDIYYLLDFSAGEQEKQIIAHTAALPPELAQLVRELETAAASIEQQPASGTYLLFGDHNMLGYKRYLEISRHAEISVNHLDAYPWLSELSARMYRLVRENELDAAGLSEQFDPGLLSLVITTPEGQYDLLRLTAIQASTDSARGGKP